MTPGKSHPEPPSDTEAGRFENAFAGFVASEYGDGSPELVDFLRDLALESRAGNLRISREGEALRRIERWPEKYPRIFGVPGEYKPVIRSGVFFYLYRYHRLETRLVEALRSRPRSRCTAVPASRAEAVIRKLSRHLDAAGAPTMNERQATAVLRGLERNPLFVTGGPGTGKTTAAVHLVTALCFDRIERGAPPPRIRIAAPTGRAAARLAEGFSRALRTNEPGLLDATERLVDGWLPRTGFTLHRLLGPAMHRDSGGLDLPFRIDADILVVDEASMADIELFTLLWESLLPDVRLILIGDPDQLPSVEAGSVFQDILPPKKGEGHFFSSHRVHLEVSHRSNAAIQEWARALSDGDAAFAARRFERSENPSDAGTESGGSVRVFDAADRGWEEAVVQFAERFGSSVPGETPPDAPFEPLDLPPGEWEGESEAVEEAFRRVNRYRILTVTRRGPRGAVRVNELLERRFCPAGAELYPGRPLLVVKNDYENRLWNGDPGVVLDVKDEGLKAFFPSEKGFRKLSVARLRDFVTGYAVTVHKSQGSEYDAVMVVLPEEPIPLLSRELLYTALTRARRHLWIAGTREVFLHALRHPVRRESGIRGSLSQ